MKTRRVGQYTVVLESLPRIIATGTVVGPKEGKGPFGKVFDHVTTDTMLGQDSFEKAEREFMREACNRALGKAGLSRKDIDFFLAGDLLNQIITASFNASMFNIPFLGLYGACSTGAEATCIAAMLVDGGYARYVLTAVSSHNNSAERQFRYPTEYGGQKPPYSQWTVTGSGASVISLSDEGVKIPFVTPGRVVDAGINDPFDMGSAMAPAAAQTIVDHLRDLERKPQDYDLIVTGDLGAYGSKLLIELVREKSGHDISDIHRDCGVMIYGEDQDVHAGGSGCACSVAMTYGYFIPEMLKGNFKRILWVVTGSLHSPTTYQQGGTMPGIAHGVVLEV